MSDAATDERRIPHFERALAHAPDQGAAPDWRVRKDILARAHEALGLIEEPPLPAEAPSAWRRPLPWAMGLMLLAAAGVGVLYQRGHLPGMQLAGKPDNERKVAGPLVPASPRADAEPAPAPAAAAPEAAPAPQAAAEDSPAAWSIDPAGPLLPSLEPTVPRTADLSKPLSPEEAQQAQEAALRLRFGLREVPPLPPLPPETPAAASVAGVATPGPAAPGAATPPLATEPPPPAPTFAALSSWTRLAIRPPSGNTFALSRAEAGDLNALLGSVVSTALRTKPFAGAVEWRLSFEQGNEGIAVLEVGRTQVRWREKGVSPTTGEPSTGALLALRNALKAQVEAHAARSAAAMTPGPASASTAAEPAPRTARTPAADDAARSAPNAEAASAAAESRSAEPVNPSRRVIKSGIPGVPDIIINLPAGAPAEPVEPQPAKP